MTCDDCLHKAECMERRGPCREYKDLRQVREDIERINENFKRASTGAKTGDKDGERSEELQLREPHLHDDAAHPRLG